MDCAATYYATGSRCAPCTADAAGGWSALLVALMLVGVVAMVTWWSLGNVELLCFVVFCYVLLFFVVFCCFLLFFLDFVWGRLPISCWRCSFGQVFPLAICCWKIFWGWGEFEGWSGEPPQVPNTWLELSQGFCQTNLFNNKQHDQSSTNDWISNAFLSHEFSEILYVLIIIHNMYYTMIYIYIYIYITPPRSTWKTVCRYMHIYSYIHDIHLHI